MSARIKDNQKIKKVLDMLDQIIFAKTRSNSFFEAEIILIINSGIEVHKDTINNHITNKDTFNFFQILLAPSTRLSHQIISKESHIIIPKILKRTFNSNCV